MKKTNNIISDWLDKYGDPEIDKQVEKEIEYINNNPMIPGVQPKFSVNLDTEEPKYRLVRERDNLTKQSARVTWLEWNEDNTFKAKHDEPAIGRSLLMSPFNQFYTWQCTPITEIVEQRDDYIKFKTKNSNYKLVKI